MIRRLGEGLGEAQDAIVAAIDYVDVASFVHGQARGCGKTGGSTVAISTWALLQGGCEIGLADHEIGLLSVREATRGTETQDAVVSSIGHVERRRVGAEVESDALRGEEFAASS